jgi:hypothetical protein
VRRKKDGKIVDGYGTDIISPSYDNIASLFLHN